jgi:hypothetical protein
MAAGVRRVQRAKALLVVTDHTKAVVVAVRRLLV